MATKTTKQPPTHLTQIPESHTLKKIGSAIHAFNSLVLDTKLRWYSEELTREYFGTQGEYDAYMQAIDHKPMDFGTIKKKINGHKYKSNHALFKDMRLVFDNAMRFNQKGSTWYNEADRLNQILHLLKYNKAIRTIEWLPYNESKCRLCPDCNNIFEALNIAELSDCNAQGCDKTIVSFICYNHKNKTQHSFCRQCTKKCSKKRTAKAHKGTVVDGLAVINLCVPIKPVSISTVDSFENVLLSNNAVLKSKIEIIIQQMRAHDGDGHFFKTVSHPKYSKYVRNPIHFGDISQKMNKNKYEKIGHLIDDIQLLWDNCYAFNGTPVLGQNEFSNYASQLQWTLEEYLKQFCDNLKAQGWITEVTPEYLKFNKLQWEEIKMCKDLLQKLHKANLFQLEHMAARVSLTKESFINWVTDTKGDNINSPIVINDLNQSTLDKIPSLDPLKYVSMNCIRLLLISIRQQLHAISKDTQSHDEEDLLMIDKAKLLLAQFETASHAYEQKKNTFDTNTNTKSSLSTVPSSNTANSCVTQPPKKKRKITVDLTQESESALTGTCVVYGSSNSHNYNVPHFQLQPQTYINTNNQYIPPLPPIPSLPLIPPPIYNEYKQSQPSQNVSNIVDHHLAKAEYYLNLNQQRQTQTLTQTQTRATPNIWQWMDECEWISYNTDMSLRIDSLINGASFVFAAFNGAQYRVTKTSSFSGTQYNLQTNYQRQIRCIEHMEHSPYPRWWRHDGNNYAKPQLYAMNLNDEITLKVMNAFYSTSYLHYTYTNYYPNIEIIKVESVENQRLYDKYKSERLSVIKSIGKDLLNEKWLFHGTKTENVMRIIQNEGFKRDFNKTARYGQGSYFAANSGYSVCYASNNNGIYKMFLCSVICGESVLGHKDYTLTNWPKKPNGLMIYDSLTDNTGNDTIYVIHEGARAYPLFVITFRIN